MQLFLGRNTQTPAPNTHPQKNFGKKFVVMRRIEKIYSYYEQKCLFFRLAQIYIVKTKKLSGVKKVLIYITIYLLGGITGYFYLKNEECISKYLSRANIGSGFEITQQDELKKAYIQKINSPVVVKGIVQEVYTNGNKEMIINMKHKNIPIDINCTLPNADEQIKKPIKLGQEINVEGLFAKFDKAILLKSCKLLQVE